MNQILANRALGILYKFLVQNSSRIEKWLLPSNICFSVPFVFILLKKEVNYYDYGYDVTKILDKVSNNGDLGILISDYYSQAWSENDIALLKQHTPILIHDACLNTPETNVSSSEADLILYSTGKGKVVDLGYGAIGYYKHNFRVDLSNLDEQEKLSIENYYSSLDNYWKKIIKSDEIFHSEKIEAKRWINISCCENKQYIQIIEACKPVILEHKKRLNNIYEIGIPKDFTKIEFGKLWRFNLFIDNPTVLLNELFKQGLFASNHYANIPDYVGEKNNTSPKAKFIERHVVNLFNDFNFSELQAQKAVNVIQYLYFQKKINPVDLSILK